MSFEMPEAVSVVMRNKDEGEVVDATLKMLKSQDYPGKVELIVIDSGSTDCSLDIIKSYKPDVLHCIEPHEYIPGKILNWGIEKASSEWVIFLNSDATPLNNSWLTNLLKAGTASGKFGAAFCRQVARDDAWAVYRIDYEKCFGENRISDTWDHFFSMVGSLANKKVWEVHPIGEEFQYAEDDEWTRRLKKEGFEIIYAEDSAVIHSHNYTYTQIIKRAYMDMQALIQAGSVSKVRKPWLTKVFISSLLSWAKDIPWHLKKGKIFELPRSLRLRYGQKLGVWRAFKEYSE